MKSPFRRFGPAVLIASFSTLVAAQAPMLDVRMGLWEVTSTTDIGGQLPPIDTSKMTPEQKAQFDAVVNGIMGAHSTVTKTCMTKEKMNRSAFLDDSNKTCKQTV